LRGGPGREIGGAILPSIRTTNFDTGRSFKLTAFRVQLTAGLADLFQRDAVRPDEVRGVSKSLRA
jgi:hypothetical protein